MLNLPRRQTSAGWGTLRLRACLPMQSGASAAVRRLAGIVTRLFEHWQLPEAQQLQLLGLHPTSRRTLREYRLGKPLPTTRDVLDRVGTLLAMHQSLRLLFPENRDVVDNWISARNRDFGDRSPLAVMLQDGIRGLLNVRGYLDEWRAI